MTGGTRRQAGHALASLLAAVSVVGLAALAAVALAPSWKRASVAAAADALAGEIRMMSVAAAADGRDRALVFPGAGGWEPLLAVTASGQDGLSRASIDAGEHERGPYFTIARDFVGVRVGLPEGDSIAGIPPSLTRLDASDPPVRFGTTRMLVVTSSGHATPGSLYLTDGHAAVCALVVYGATTRVRTWCYERGSDSWRLR